MNKSIKDYLDNQGFNIEEDQARVMGTVKRKWGVTESFVYNKETKLTKFYRNGVKVFEGTVDELEEMESIYPCLNL